ncbi:MAG: MBL fold metallo-hydrolase [Jiangellaceae bacterium]
MLLLTVPAPVLGTNCYLLAVEDGHECVIVDPGIGLDEKVDEGMAEYGLRPAAVLITHGHLDHTFSLAQLCRRHELPVYIHEADAYRLADPLGTVSPEFAHLFAPLADDWSPPPDIRPLRGGEELELAGLGIEVLHAPGHTEGSTLYRLPAPDDHTANLCLTGDVLFAGTIGRTDLPGGDHATMLTTLATVVLGLADATTVLPGHGEPSTIGRERATNPFLKDLGSRSG